MLSRGAKAAAGKNVLKNATRIVPVGYTLTPEQTEGPFYIAKHLIRSDIREDRVGTPLQLSITLKNVNTGRPIPHAAVDIWHCDAEGNYSGYAEQAESFKHHRPDFGHDGFGIGPPRFGPKSNFGPPPGAPRHDHMFPKPPTTDKKTYLRGTQFSDVHGQVNFLTIVPGWYQGRGMHMHLKIFCHNKNANSSTADRLSGTHVCHTGQLFFPEDQIAALTAGKVYGANQTARLKNDEDMVFVSQQGKKCLLTIEKLPASQGFCGKIILNINPETQPEPV